MLRTEEFEKKLYLSLNLTAESGRRAWCQNFIVTLFCIGGQLPLTVDVLRKFKDGGCLAELGEHIFATYFLKSETPPACPAIFSPLSDVGLLSARYYVPHEYSLVTRIIRLMLYDVVLEPLSDTARGEDGISAVQIKKCAGSLRISRRLVAERSSDEVPMRADSKPLKKTEFTITVFNCNGDLTSEGENFARSIFKKMIKPSLEESAQECPMKKQIILKAVWSASDAFADHKVQIIYMSSSPRPSESRGSSGLRNELDLVKARLLAMRAFGSVGYAAVVYLVEAYPGDIRDGQEMYRRDIDAKDFIDYYPIVYETDMDGKLDEKSFGKRKFNMKNVKKLMKNVFAFYYNKKDKEYSQ